MRISDSEAQQIIALCELNGLVTREPALDYAVESSGFDSGLREICLPGQQLPSRAVNPDGAFELSMSQSVALRVERNPMSVNDVVDCNLALRSWRRWHNIGGKVKRG